MSISNNGRWHLFSRHGLNILVDGPTGAVHLLDEAAMEVFPHFTDGAVRSEVVAEANHPRAGDAWDQLAALRESGMLMGPEPVFPQRPGAGLKALCLHVSHDCDLRCRYCFAGTGSFGGKRELMSEDVARQAVDMLLSQSSRVCELDFFGGEPLLNLEVVENTAAYARNKARSMNKHINLTLTTNAVSLTGEVRERLLALDLDLVLSHDGRPEVHDAMRPTCSGGDSYRQITDNILSVVKDVHPRYYVRGTYTALNSDFSREIEHWLSLGIKRFSLEPVVAPEESRLALTSAHLPQLAEEYWRVADIVLEQGSEVTFFHFLLDWEQGPCGAKRAAGCGAGMEYLAVAPDGTLFPCHQFVGEPQWALGSVQAGVQKTSLQQLFVGTTIADKADCRECWARYYCGGGCHANAWWANGDLCEPWETGCQLQRIRTEAALYVKVRQQIEYLSEGDSNG